MEILDLQPPETPRQLRQARGLPRQTEVEDAAANEVVQLE
jgi:hypothetical protein